LAQRTAHSAESSQVADAITSMFEDINRTLIPIIGPKGVAALHRRSLFLCTSAYPQFADTYKTLIVAMDLGELKSLLAEQNKGDALFFCEALLKTFYELLATLIGRSLAARLLLDVWGRPLSGTPVQENSP